MHVFTDNYWKKKILSNTSIVMKKYYFVWIYNLACNKKFKILNLKEIKELTLWSYLLQLFHIYQCVHLSLSQASMIILRYRLLLAFQLFKNKLLWVLLLLHEWMKKCSICWYCFSEIYLILFRNNCYLFFEVTRVFYVIKWC